jgi:CRISPR-associated endonuclease/helicase Cas3
MRGGILRDDEWVDNPAQPAIITSTVDQVGSRLLFRGYGPGALSQSIHAGLVCCDSLILLDEAHCSVPFLQTAQAVRKYSSTSWVEKQIARPLSFVVLSATLPDSIPETERFPSKREKAKILSDPALRPRIETSKIATLQTVKSLSSCASDQDSFVDEAANLAGGMIQSGRKRIAVMVNRVAIAHKVHAALKKRANLPAQVALMTGRMRAVDRDALVERLDPVLRSAEPCDPLQPLVLVTTQCLEVGADFSFDGLITECASLDALRQRFGRMNRLGGLDVTKTSAVILIQAGDIVSEKGPDGLVSLEKQGKVKDPIYGNALARTWHWLAVDDSQVDMCTTQLDRRIADTPPACGTAKLAAPVPDAPLLMPAHLDLFCQTAPQPEPDPDVGPFLHGRYRGTPEARVVFRADLVWDGSLADKDNLRHWADAVCMLPPNSAEALSVPLWRLREWLGGASIESDNTGDVEGERLDEKRERLAEPRPFFVWRGRDRSFLSHDPASVKANDTVVVQADEDWAGALGHYFNRPTAGSTLDAAERAYFSSGRRAVLRVNGNVLAPWHRAQPVRDLLAWARSEEQDSERLLLILNALRDHPSFESESDVPDWLRQLSGALSENVDFEPYEFGVLLSSRQRRAAQAQDEFADIDDMPSFGKTGVSLADHTTAVVKMAESFTALGRRIIGPTEAHTVRMAAKFHDAGKADLRFQTLLRGRLPTADEYRRPLAKSDRAYSSRTRRRWLREISELPDGFRHEMLSMQLVEPVQDRFDGAVDRDLFFHLIASHHGWGRPFAPTCEDVDPPDVGVEICGVPLSLDAQTRRQMPPPCRLDSGVADRFWRLKRKFGWWGLAYLEALLRLADWKASE